MPGASIMAIVKANAYGHGLIPVARHLVQLGTEQLGVAFLEEGIRELLDEITPISDFSGKKLELHFLEHSIGEPKYDEEFARNNIRTYEAPIKATVKLINKTLGSEKSQELFLADMPIMTPHGSFIVSGVERAIVPQLARSFGAFFVSELMRGKPYFGAKIIPLRGVWIEIDSEANGAIFVKIDRKRMIHSRSRQYKQLSHTMKLRRSKKHTLKSIAVCAMGTW